MNGLTSFSKLINMNVRSAGASAATMRIRPAKTCVNINLSGHSGKITGRLYNHTGQSVLAQILGTGKNCIHTGHLPLGNYTLEIINEKKEKKYFTLTAGR